MSRIILSICGLFLMLSQAAFAAESMRIWDAASSGEGFVEFQHRLGKLDGVYPDGSLSAEKLALGACSMATQQKLYGGSLAECQTSFRQLNGLPVASKFGNAADKVTIQTFLGMARGTGWQLPLQATVMPSAAAATPASPEASNLQRQLTTLQQQVASGKETVASLRNQVSVIEKQLDGAKLSTRELSQLKASLAALRNGELDKQISSAVSGQLLPIANDLSDRLDDTTEQVGQLSGKVEGFEKQFETYNGQLGTVQSRFEENRTLIYGLGGIVVVVICFMIFGGRTQRKQGKRLMKVESDVGELAQRVSTIEAKADAAATSAAEALATANETRDALLTAADVRLDSANLSVDELSRLSVGEEHAVVWRGMVMDQRFEVTLWLTPDYQVQTDIVRNVESGQLSDPMSLRRLVQRVKTAALDGRVRFVSVARVAA